MSLVLNKRMNSWLFERIIVCHWIFRLSSSFADFSVHLIFSSIDLIKFNSKSFQTSMHAHFAQPLQAAAAVRKTLCFVDL